MIDHSSRRARPVAGARAPAMDSLRVPELFGVRGKNVLVTGGARGIGLMIASGFVANGADVYIASRDAAACDDVATKLTASGPGTCVALGSADLSTEEGCAYFALCCPTGEAECTARPLEAARPRRGRASSRISNLALRT